MLDSVPGNGPDKRKQGIPESASGAWQINDSTPSVVVVITELNAARTIKGCLQRVFTQTYPREKYSVILVDAGSDDGTLELAKEFGATGLRIVVRRGCSEPEGQHTGVELTSSDIVLFTNSDIYVPPDWIAKHVEWHRRGYGLVGGGVFWGGDKYTFAWNTARGRGPTFEIEEGAGIGFSNCSVVRSLYASAGGIRDLHSQQDIEFAFRVVRSGGRLVLDPAIEVYHNHPQKSLSFVLRRSFGYAYNHMLVVKIFYGRLKPAEGMPIRIDLGQQVANILGLRARRVYRERHQAASSWGINIGFWEFLFIRQCVRFPAHYLGLVLGYLTPAPNLESVRNLHRLNPAVN
ncbi:MAG: glycosyltransferase [Thermoplasmata archaeon]